MSSFSAGSQGALENPKTLGWQRPYGMVKTVYRRENSVAETANCEDEMPQRYIIFRNFRRIEAFIWERRLFSKSRKILTKKILALLLLTNRGTSPRTLWCISYTKDELYSNTTQSSSTNSFLSSFPLYLLEGAFIYVKIFIRGTFVKNSQVYGGSYIISGVHSNGSIYSRKYCTYAVRGKIKVLSIYTG